MKLPQIPPMSISDAVFFEIATTLCILAVTGQATVEQFLGIAGIVFGAYYVHKAQNKPQIPTGENQSSTTTTTNTIKSVEPEK